MLRFGQGFVHTHPQPCKDLDKRTEHNLMTASRYKLPVVLHLSNRVIHLCFVLAEKRFTRKEIGREAEYEGRTVYPRDPPHLDITFKS